jgi:alkylation response protein AidB-like acyl-CoA dehydrogenase
MWSQGNQELMQFATKALGPQALTGSSTWGRAMLRSRGNSIEGGTTEVLKNIIAERVLGLPRKK